MTKTRTPTYTSPRTSEPRTSEPGLPLMPVETEIYILPSGEIVIADLPAELAALIAPGSPGAPEPDPNRQEESGAAA